MPVTSTGSENETAIGMVKPGVTYSLSGIGDVTSVTMVDLSSSRTCTAPLPEVLPGAPTATSWMPSRFASPMPVTEWPN